MKLKEIIAKMGSAEAMEFADREISGIAYDSRRVTPGMLFVAIPGQTADGHEHIKSAIHRGAAAVICQRDGVNASRAAVIRVPDTRVALAGAAAAFYSHPSSQLDVVAVTGTNGKTTVSFMIKHILTLVGRSSGLLGTVRYEIGERMIPAQRTTPEALEIQRMMREMLRSGCDSCVMEVSSHGLMQNRVDQVEFDVAVFTNLTPEHLDFHGDMNSYFAAKRRLFETSRGGRSVKSAVINLDDPYGAHLLSDMGRIEPLTFGRTAEADLRLLGHSVGADSTAFSFVVDGENHNCQLPLLGCHNVLNALAAIGAAMQLGISPSQAAKALETVPTPPGRMEKIRAGQPFSALVDYAHTDNALANALATLREVTEGRLLTVFGCGGDRDAGKRGAMGAIAARLADETIITNDNPRNEPPEAIAAQIVAGYRSVRRDGFTVELDRERAIREAVGRARPGDAVLIAGKGHETYQEIQHTVAPFDDRAHVRDALETLGYPS